MTEKKQPKLVYRTTNDKEDEEKKEDKKRLVDYVYNPSHEQLLQLSIVPRAQLVKIAFRVTNTPEIVNDPERKKGTLPLLFTMNLLRLSRSQGGAMLKIADRHVETEMAGAIEDGELGGDN